ncbi:MAG: hemin uptake protein HemP [Gemmatimonadales bacterium]|nr:hemin uptake protein HemP [Gemmatimonadales bacterium]
MTHIKVQPADSSRRPEGASPSAKGRPASTRRFESSDLFAGTDEVFIQHRGREYRLRITQNGKLILNA